MKKITILILTILPMFGFAQTFDFTNSTDGWDAVTTGATLVSNPSFVAVNLTDGVSNPKFGNSTAGVDGVTNTVCAVTLQNLSATGPTFLRISYPKVGSGRVYQQQDITAGDSGFVTYYFDLTNSEWGNDVPENDIQVHFKAAGNNNYIVPAGGVTVNVDKIEFIASVPTTLQESYSFNTDDDTEGFIATNGSISGPTAGILTFTPTADKYAKLEQVLHHVDADAHKYIHITLKNNSATNDQLRLVSSGPTQLLTMSTSDATEKTYDFDMSGVVEWTGSQTFTVGIGSTVAASPGQANDSGTVEFNSIVIDNVLGTKDFEISSFSFYPNPVKDILNINGKTEISKVQVYDITGKQVLETARLYNNQLNVSSLKTGLYLLRIEDVNKNSAVKKLLIQ